MVVSDDNKKLENEILEFKMSQEVKRIQLHYNQRYDELLQLIEQKEKPPNYALTSTFHFLLSSNE